MKLLKSLAMSISILSLCSCGLRSAHANLIQEGYDACKTEICSHNDIEASSYRDSSVDYVYFVETTGVDKTEEIVAYAITYKLNEDNEKDYYYYHSNTKTVVSVSYNRFASIYNSVEEKSISGEVGSIK